MVSDVQEKLDYNLNGVKDTEINQTLNLIKYLVDTTLTGKESA
jgi:hypothetical protein